MNKEQEKRFEYKWHDHGDHILTIPNCFEDRIVDDCIREFDDLENRGLVSKRRIGNSGSHKHLRADNSIFYTSLDPMVHGPMQEINDIINNEILDSWLEEYPLIETGLYNELYVGQMKMQKTRMTEGYHNWHCEHSAMIKDRMTLLAFMVYLNDVDEGGETEFLYQSKRIKPVRNTFVVWPAGFTHTHRGNPPLSNVKYVITGWINCI